LGSSLGWICWFVFRVRRHFHAPFQCLFLFLVSLLSSLVCARASIVSVMRRRLWPGTAVAVCSCGAGDPQRVWSSVFLTVLIGEGAQRVLGRCIVPFESSFQLNELISLSIVFLLALCVCVSSRLVSEARHARQHADP